ncbi:MAG: CYTH domain-containing protein [Deferrisomatales bacterium]|nr:CYTH domain-containing protein [Deferrisomatales bacterium]
MGTEIERKFLVHGDAWRPDVRGVAYRQGYLTTDPERTVRVRIAGRQAFLTVKGKTRGATRAEFEYPIPVEDAARLLDELCQRPLVEKTRYTLRHGAHEWVLDEFHGDNAGLLLAEVELSSEGEGFSLPPWAGREVTEDPRYYNANLIAHPYRQWKGGAG